MNNDLVKYFVASHNSDYFDQIDNPFPVGEAELKSTIEDILDHEHVCDDDIAIYILSDIKVKATKSIEIIRKEHININLVKDN